MSPGDWDSAGWHVQRMYIEGMEAEGLISAGAGGEEAAQEAGIGSRKADTGASVINLAEMRDALGGR
jgi:hypothetical protein